MLDFEIRKSLIEADACDFATGTEVRTVFQKWKAKNDILQLCISDMAIL
jgi:hypothetical protein